MRLSKEKKEKISEQILAHLYTSFPNQLFTAEVAKEIARDEEFVKTLLFELKDKNLVVAVKKNEEGKDFIRRVRWQLTSPAYQAYDMKAKSQQNAQVSEELTA
jgi:flagellin-specific chaperone FliS